MRFRWALRRATLAVMAVATAVGGLAPTTPAAAATGDVSTFAGGPGRGAATSLRTDGFGSLQVVGNKLYMSDYLVLRVVDLATGQASVVAGNGVICPPDGAPDGVPATSACMERSPSGIAVDPAGNVFYSERLRVRRVDAQTGILTTYAGNNAGGSAGDGGPALAASFNAYSLSLDAAGNMFIADSENNRVRRVDATTKVITTVAGSGPVGFASAGFSGDGAPATSARLNAPEAVTVDGTGNLYIADSANNRVRKVSATGIITTVVGSGSIGIGHGGFGGDGGPATSALLDDPEDVGVGVGGNLYIADAHNNRVRRVDPAGTISTAAGSGPTGVWCGSSTGDGGAATSAQIDRPVRLTVDGSTIYVGEEGRVRRVDPTGTITTVAGSGWNVPGGDGGPATSAFLDLPSGITVDRTGNVLIGTGPWVRKVNPGGTISTLAGAGQQPRPDLGPCEHQTGFGGDGGPATDAFLNGGFGLAVDGAGAVYIADTENQRIRKVGTDGIISTYAGGTFGGFGGDGGPATSAQLHGPAGLAVDRDGNLYIADTDNDRIRRVDHLSQVITTVAGTGTPGFGGDGGPATAAELSGPSGLAIDAAGNLLVADSGNVRVRRIDATTGFISTVAGDGVSRFAGDGGAATSASLAGAVGVVVDGAGSVFIADGFGDNRVRKVDPTGRITTVAGDGAIAPNAASYFGGDGGPATSAELQSPTSMAVTADGSLLITDELNYRVRRVEGVAVPPAPLPLLPGAAPADFKGNGTTDVSVFRPSTGTWFVQGGPAVSFGTSGDIPVPGAYNGDGKTDVAVFRPSTGQWFISGGPSVNFGTSGDIPVPGDYNGDGKTDIGVFRPSTGQWFTPAQTAYGVAGDIPLPLAAAIGPAVQQ